MKKILFLLLTVVAYLGVYSQAQTILLFTENFDNDGGNVPVVFDAIAPDGFNKGPNDWIINNSYDGLGIYPNTPSEDSTTNGLIINNAPFSNYLHIHNIDAAATNANWQTDTFSDRFCYLGSTFCTLGLSNVQFTFDWVCQGNITAYGQVFYRADGGPWIQIGKPKYYNASEWTYESIQDPQLDNQANIQIGFRWVNPNSAGATNISFGLDDIFAVGSYNPADTFAHATLTAQVYSTQICQGDPVLFSVVLSNPMCDGNYEVELSDSVGSFSRPFNIGVIQGDASFTGGVYNSLPTNDQLSGNCFKIRVVRTGPPPMIISDTSICFSIVFCPNSIFNIMSPVIQNDADTTCIQSEVDIMFNSTGVFKADNIYYAEISDASGNFADSTLLGTLASGDSFPSIPPGDISGLIPKSVPPGCGYRLRVRSSDPAVYNYMPGTFCLKRCDVLTNNITDLHFCVASGPYPECDSINITDHHWDTVQQYTPCNNWTIQLRKMSDFSLVNAGGLGVYHNEKSGNFELCMPSTVDSLPVAPGSYYMRITSSCSNETVDSTGTVIRITIGAPSSTAPSLFVNDTVACAGTEIIAELEPFNPNSSYEWTIFFEGFADTLVGPYPGIGVVPPGTGFLIFQVQEINNGCFGPASTPAIVDIIGNPKVVINGPTLVCLGDTAQYNVTFLDETYYLWTATPAAGADVLDVSNVQTNIVFDRLGFYNISNYCINGCGSEARSIHISVVPPYYSLGVLDTAICFGDSVVVDANPTPLIKNFQVQDTGSLETQGGMFNIVAHEALTIDSFGVYLSSYPNSLNAAVYGKTGSYFGYERTPSAWKLLGRKNSPSGFGQFTVIEVEAGEKMAAGDTLAFYVTSLDTGADIYYGAGDNNQVSFYNSDGNIDFYDGTVLDYPFKNNLTGQGYVLNVQVFYSTRVGFTYAWSNDSTGQQFEIAPSQNVTYYLQVTDHGQCALRDTMSIKVNPVPTVNAGPDTSVCPNQPYVMQGTSSISNILWKPSVGLSSVTDLNAIFSYADSVTYVLIATDTQTNCSRSDTVNILVPLRLTLLSPDTTLCQGNNDTLRAVSTGVSFNWTPGQNLNDASILNPVYLSANNSGGRLTITASDENGCRLSDSLLVLVEICNSKIVAPTAFTPAYSGNGTGEPDNSFIVWGKNIREYEVRIYNRWGEKVYDSGMMGELDDNFSPPLWNGVYKGKIQDTGTFVYYISATDHNGKSIEQKGNVTLVR